MSTLKPARGTALRQHSIVTRFAPVGHGSRPQILRTNDIPKIRQLLRTDKTVSEIADEFGVSRPTMRNFIKRRRICDVAERDKFIKLQKSLQKLEAIE